MNASRHPVFAAFAAAALLQAPAATGQHSITGMVKTPTNLALAWETSSPPYLVQTSSNLVDWCDQGAVISTAAVVRASMQSGAFYRMKYLNPTNQLGAFYGLIETEQGEGGQLLARHRLKSLWWFYTPPGTLSKVPATFFRKLFVFFQHIEDDRVTTFAGPLESLGYVTTNGQFMAVYWSRNGGEENYRLLLEFPYSATNSRATTPLPSDPYYTLRCIYTNSRPEFDSYEMAMGTTKTDLVSLVQLAPAGQLPPGNSYAVTNNGARVDLAYTEGLPLCQGSPPDFFKTYILNQWTAPATAGGGSLPAFSTDSYFSRTLLPGHHNFVESTLIEPALDPALGETTRAALRAANIRYVYTMKDIDIGLNADDIRLIGYDNTLRTP